MQTIPDRFPKGKPVPIDLAAFANDFLRRTASYLGGACASCHAPMVDHFAVLAKSPENPHGFIGCPAIEKERQLVATIADVLVHVLALREGVTDAHLEHLAGDVREEYLAAARLALARLGLVSPEVTRG